MDCQYHPVVRLDHDETHWRVTCELWDDGVDQAEPAESVQAKVLISDEPCGGCVAEYAFHEALASWEPKYS